MREARSATAAFLICSGALMAGCAVGPDYHRPQAPVDAGFVNAAEPGLAAGDPDERYWTTFGDPKLTQLVEDSVTHNTDLQAATANLQAARAARRLAAMPTTMPMIPATTPAAAIAIIVTLSTIPITQGYG